MMQVGCYLLRALLLASLCAASAAQHQAHAAIENCTAAEMGKLSGLKGVHLETLLPAQHSLVLKIPPVCSKQNGISVTACEITDVAPSLALHGREVALARHGDAAGFAMLSVAVYCELAAPAGNSASRLSSLRSANEPAAALSVAPPAAADVSPAAPIVVSPEVRDAMFLPDFSQTDLTYK